MSVFILDIGTRKVAGIIGEIRNGRTSIIDAVVKEHDKRAMMDGQIHNIEDVSKIVRQIKNELEERNSVTLDKVTTALAGRSLHTEKIEIVKEKKGEVTKEDIQKLEISSVKKAHEYIKERNKTDYYCVGYSVSQFFLDNDSMKNIEQQIAKETIGIHTIVTFLPKIVFDSMISVLKNCGLSLSSMTLEPIAAIQVTIPEDMRMLNLALVDVGAGTSDIAITEGGRITAYGMIPKAGDEITEQLCNEFLVDFHGAEKLKRMICRDVPFEFTDIFNNSFKVTYPEFKNIVESKVQEVAKDIADEILSLNGKQPKAVVMVGGGSGLDFLREKVAENLSLPLNRVGSREPKNISNAENLPAELEGTEGVTPLGILDIALHNKGLAFIEVFINGEKAYIINMDQKITLMDAVIAHGIEMKSLYGKPGNALTFLLNGEMKIIRGSKGEHSRFYVNNEEKQMDDEIKNGDKIFISETKDGSEAGALIKDVVPADSFITVEVNGKTEKLEPVITVGGKQVSIDEPLQDRSDIRIQSKNKLEDILSGLGYVLSGSGERDIIITLQGEPISLKQRNFTLKVNGAETNGDYIVKNMDKIEFIDKPSFYRIKDILSGSIKNKMKVIINKKEYELETEQVEVIMNGRKVFEDEFIINGANIELKASTEKVILSTIFRSFDMDTQRVKGKMLDLRVNGEPAGYTSPIKEGDEIEIRYI